MHERPGGRSTTMNIEIAPLSESPNSGNWVQKNLFSTWYNSILTIVCLVVTFQGLKSLLFWATTKAQWYVISANLRLFFAGQYPLESTWRLWVIVAIVAFLSNLTWGNLQRQSLRWSRPVLLASGVAAVLVVSLPIGLNPRLILTCQIVVVAGGYWLGQQLNPKFSRWLSLVWVISFPVVFWLIGGGLGLKQVPTANWSGLLLTLLAAVVSIVLSFPIGVLLALGRQSSLPVVRLFSILYIEVIRGLPLIGVLFLAQVMLPLFLPPELRQLDRVFRAVAGLTLFSAAYLAEDVRGGLQAVPRGQGEAARALGLSPPLVVTLVVLPQALRAVIPALVGEFVGLFKETTLLSVFGLLEFLGISLSILANPQFIGRYAEVYLFIGAIYWFFCYSMSVASRRLEAHLNADQR